MNNRPKTVSCSYLWLCLWLLPFLYGTGSAAPPWVVPEGTLNFHRISVEQGLSQSTIYAMMQDRFGFVWVATQDGLNRFDGANFTVFRSQPGGLPESFIYSLAEDAVGNIWIATQSRGVSCFVRETETFVNYSVRDSGSGLPSDQINFLLVDSRDRLWVATETGVCRYDAKSNTFGSVSVAGDNATVLDNLKVRAMVEDQRGRIWLGGEHHLLCFDPTTGQLSKHLEDETLRPDIYALCSDDKGTIWVGSNNHGLIRLRPDQNQVKVFSELGRPGSRDQVWSLAADEGDHLWIGTEAGLVLASSIYEETIQFRRFTHDSRQLRSLPGDVVYVLFRDRAENLWVGTIENGIAVLSPSFRAVHCFREAPMPLRPNELSSLGTVGGFVATGDGSLWLTSERGLYRWDQDGHRFEPFVPTTEAVRERFAKQRFAQVQRDENDRLWVSSSTGLWLVDPSRGHAEAIALDGEGGERPAIIHSMVYCQGALWAGVYGRGLARVDCQTLAVDYVTDGAESPVDPFILSMDYDQAGRLWLATQASGLSVYDIKSGRFEHYRHNPEDPASIATDALSVVTCVAEDDLWLGGIDRGLMRMNPKTGTFASLPESARFEGQAVNGMVHDHAGRLWVAGNAGIAAIDLKTLKVRGFSVFDNLQGREFSHAAIYETGDGRLLFGGLAGFNRIDPSRLRPVIAPGSVVLTGLALNDQEQGGATLAGWLADAAAARPIQLSHHDRRLSVEFALPGAPLFAPVRFYSKLENWDEDWQAHKPNRASATYTNLTAGKYVFKVRAMDPFGQWQTAATELPLSVSPPPWLSWWAYLIYLFLAAVLSGFAYQALQQKLTLERSLNEQLRQNDRFKDEFTQSLEHKLAARTRQLEESNQQLKKSNYEMNLVEQIVLAINEQLEIKPLLQTVTDKSLSLFSRAESALFLLRDGQSDRFLAVAGSGFKNPPSAIDFITEETLIRQFTNNGHHLVPGITVLRSFPGWGEEPCLNKYRVPKVLLCLGVGVAERVLGFLVFFHYEDSEAFDIHDNQRLTRLAQHLASALIKARMLEELKAKNSEILRTQRQLITQEKMASLGTLTTGIAHEIRNPLNFVTNFAEVSGELVQELRDEGAPLFAGLDVPDRERFRQIMDELAANAETIHKHGARAASIVQSMMDLVRGPSGTWQDTELNGIVWEFSQIAFRGFRARDELFHVAFDYALDENLTYIEANPKDLRRLVINLVNNAIEAAADPEFRGQEGFQPQVWLRTHGDERRAVLEVGNNGAAFSAEIKEQMFNPFFTTKGTNSGHIGLGLSICYDIVAQHKGSIDAEIDASGLTWFRVTLPRRRRMKAP